MKKKLLALLLALMMVLSAVPAAAFAAEGEGLSDTGSVSGRVDSPLRGEEAGTVSGWQKAETVRSQLSGSVAAQTVGSYETDMTVAARTLGDAMAQRQDVIELAVAIPKSEISTKEDLEACLEAVFYLAMGHNGVPNQGDYLLWHFAYMEYEAGYKTEGDDYHIDAVYYLDYYTDAAQEQAVTARVDEVIDSFGFTGRSTDEYKIKTVYDYICTHVAYDYDNVNDQDYTLMYTAYAALMEGKAVCQGYASLLYRMLLELDIDCRVITGDTNGDGKSDHAWNIVALGDVYYNADSTWDAGIGDYDYYLKSPDNFPGHTRDGAYDSADFHAAYPMTESDYQMNALTLVAEGTCGENAAWTRNRVGTLIIYGTGAVDSGAFRSDEDIFAVVVEEGITGIGDYAFYQCSNITELTLPATVTAMGEDCFGFVTATATYPCGEGWTVDVTADYGGTLTWKKLHGTEVTDKAVAATCTATGLTEGKHCCVCGEVLVKQEVVAAEGHSEVVDKAVAATCTKTGLTEGKHCSVCNSVLVKQEVVPAEGHKGENGVCGVCGAALTTITQQPADVMVKSGKTAKVTVAAEGEGLTYAWYWAPAGSEDFQLTTSFKGTSYSITMNESRDGRQVFCRVTDKFGSFVDSDIVTLHMAKPPVITVQPTYAYAKKGEEAVVSFEATGNGELTYEWYWAKAGSSTYKKTTSFTGPEYSVEMEDSRAGRKVYCVVTDAFGLSTKTKTVTLRMALEIVNDLTDAKAVSGKKASVTVKANGQGLKYEWYYSDGGAFKKTTSFTGPTYSLTMKEARDGRQVYCRITDKYGNSVETAKATLTMVPPPQIVVEPTFVYARKGEEAVVSFEATGTGELTYEWYWAKAGSSTYKKTTSFTGPEYKVEMDDSRAGRKVYCVVTDETGVSVKTKTVTLRMELEITGDIESVCGRVGDRAVFTVEVNGQGLKYEWFYSDDGGATFKKTNSFKGDTYAVTYTDERMGRQVFCRITDKYGNTVQTITASMEHD